MIKNVPIETSGPFLTVAITTYQRPQLLRQLIASILSNAPKGIEILIGNDDVDNPLRAEDLWSDQNVVKIINHPFQLGELKNMNALFNLARGRYFTWQFDDDLYAEGYFEDVFRTLSQSGYPSALFSSFGVITGKEKNLRSNSGNGYKNLTGREFIRSYLSGSLRVLGCSGIYEHSYLRSIGAAASLSSSPFALYSEYLLILQAGLLQRVVYLDRVGMYYRFHRESWGCSSNECVIYKEAGRNLWARGIECLAAKSLRPDFNENVDSLFKKILSDCCLKMILEPKSSFSAFFAREFSNELISTLEKSLEKEEFTGRDETVLTLKRQALKQIIRAWFLSLCSPSLIYYLQLIRHKMRK